MPRTLWRRWCVGILMFLLVGISGVMQPEAHAQNPNPLPPSPFPPLWDVVVHGAHLPPIYYNNTEVNAYNQLMGKQAGIVMNFYSWGFMMPDTQCGFVDMTMRHPPRPRPHDCGPNPTGPEITNTTLMFTWEPNQNPAAPYSCPLMQGGRTNLDAVINGQCDAYIDEFARRIKSWNAQHGDNFMLRLAHEMNISDQKWYQNSPDYPAKYVSFWRHVVNRFRAQGVSRDIAQFVWSPNYASNPANAWNRLPNYYPGDQYVDWVGLSGYNWFGANGQDPNWRSFQDLFNSPDASLGGSSVLEYLHCNYAKPIVLAEIGTVEGNNPQRSKAAWIRDTMQQLPNFPFIKAIVWFNDYAYGSPGSADFRVTQSSVYSTPNRDHFPGWHRSLGAVSDAWRETVSQPHVLATVPRLSQITPLGTICEDMPLSAHLRVPQRTFVERGGSVNIPVEGILLQPTAYTLNVTSLPSDISTTFAPTTVSRSQPDSTMRVSASANAALVTHTLQAIGTSSSGQATSQLFEIIVVDELNSVYLPLSNNLGPR